LAKDFGLSSLDGVEIMVINFNCANCRFIERNSISALDSVLVQVTGSAAPMARYAALQEQSSLQ